MLIPLDAIEVGSSATTVRSRLIGRARRRVGETEREFDADIERAVRAEGYKPRTPHEADAAALLIIAERGER